MNVVSELEIEIVHGFGDEKEKDDEDEEAYDENSYEDDGGDEKEEEEEDSDDVRVMGKHGDSSKDQDTTGYFKVPCRSRGMTMDHNPLVSVFLNNWAKYMFPCTSSQLCSLVLLHRLLSF